MAKMFSSGMWSFTSPAVLMYLKTILTSFCLLVLFLAVFGGTSYAMDTTQTSVKEGRRISLSDKEQKAPTHCQSLYKGNCMFKKDCKQFNHIKWNTNCDGINKICCTEELKYRRRTAEAVDWKNDTETLQTESSSKGSQ